MGGTYPYPQHVMYPPPRVEELITLLTNSPLLAFPDPEEPYILHTDASQDGLGAVLYQKQKGKNRVIAYASRTLSPAEKKYNLHSRKLEFLALKWAITDQFRDYLYYAPSFKVYTDNNPLAHVMSSARLNATGMRWVGELADYRFTVHYRPGKSNGDADGLSRMPQGLDQIALRKNALLKFHMIFCKQMFKWCQWSIATLDGSPSYQLQQEW